MKKGSSVIRMFLVTLGKVKRGLHQELSFVGVLPFVENRFGLCTFVGIENI